LPRTKAITCEERLAGIKRSGSIIQSTRVLSQVFSIRALSVPSM
jgi:hypothetical protein